MLTSHSTPHPATHHLRRNLLKVLAIGALKASTVGVGLAGLIGQVLAAGSGPHRKQGIYRLEGEATFNGKTLKVGDIPTLPVTVVTGPETLLVFVIAADAYLVRANSHLVLQANVGKSTDATPEISRVESIKLISGKLLSVFEKGERRITTRTAVAGIRGTGIYLESEPARTYACLCYGSAEMGPIDAPQQLELVQTTHHESPRWITRTGMKPAKMINHTDDELILLESLTGRVPPFFKAWANEENLLTDQINNRY